jgi:hypothetical protein
MEEPFAKQNLPKTVGVLVFFVAVLAFVGYQVYNNFIKEDAPPPSAAVQAAEQNLDALAAEATKAQGNKPPPPPPPAPTAPPTRGATKAPK